MIYKLGEICNIQSGGTPPRAVQDYYNSPYIPWVKVGDLDKGEVIIQTDEFISESGLQAIGNRVFHKGAVLLAMYGSVGKTSIAGTQVTSNQAVLGIDSNDKNLLDNRFLKYWLDFHRAILIFKSKGGVLKNLSLTYVKNLEIDLPTIAEQINIIERFVSVEELIKKRKLTLNLLDEYLHSLFYTLFGNPINNDKGWQTHPLEYFGNWSTGGTPPRKEEKYFANGTIPWFSSGELNDYYISESNEKITEDSILKTSAKKVKAGSLMVGMYDTAALKCSITQNDCSCNQAIAFSKLKDEINSFFALMCLRIGKEHYLTKRKGVRQKNLNLSFIRSIEIILPPLDLQNKYESVFQETQIQKEHCNRSLTFLEELLQVVIFRVFDPHQKIVLDKIDSLIDDDIQIELFLNTIKSSDFENEEQYSNAIKDLYKILNRTSSINKINPLFLKGIIQTAHDQEIVLETNREHKYRLNDEASIS